MTASPEIPTDEEMAILALRLTKIVCELTRIARALLIRFPSNAEVAEAVEDFLKDIEALGAEEWRR